LQSLSAEINDKKHPFNSDYKDKPCCIQVGNKADVMSTEPLAEANVIIMFVLKVHIFVKSILCVFVLAVVTSMDSP